MAGEHAIRQRLGQSERFGLHPRIAGEHFEAAPLPADAGGPLRIEDRVAEHAAVAAGPVVDLAIDHLRQADDPADVQ